mmetsp:Transcript_93680/g.200989  ORF Transcript_93680/g.200989 Transcript_93680/m.200989 type:complete len:89 (+) Transcript_93680:482-748(+)
MPSRAVEAWAKCSPRAPQVLLLAQSLTRSCEDKYIDNMNGFCIWQFSRLVFGTRSSECHWLHSTRTSIAERQLRGWVHLKHWSVHRAE